MIKLPYIERHPLKRNIPKRVFNILDEMEEALEQSKGWSGSYVFNSDLSKLDLTCPKGKELLSKINKYDDLTTWPSDLQEIMARFGRYGFTDSKQTGQNYPASCIYRPYGRVCKRRSDKSTGYNDFQKTWK